MMADLAAFLTHTGIPANHDAISAAWEKQRLSFEAFHDEDLGVPASIQEQKALAEAKVASRTTTVATEMGPKLVEK